jgi:hypothetical protein
VTFDLVRFDALLDESRTLEPADALQRLEEALLVAAADVLEDAPYATWAEDLRGVYRARVLGARLDTADLAFFERDYPTGLVHAEAAASLDLFRSAHRLMMQLYALAASTRH